MSNGATQFIMPQLLEANPERTTETNAMLRKSVRNVRISQLYRADYEGRSLRKVRKLSNRVCNEAILAPVEMLPALVNAFDKLCERERILLRIPLPAAAKSSEPRSIPGRTSTSLVVREPIETGPGPMPGNGASKEPGPRSGPR